jgi:predicted PurR-regulated permease PerM
MNGEDAEQFWTWQRVLGYALVAGAALFVVYKQPLVLYVLQRLAHVGLTLLLAVALAYLLKPIVDVLARVRLPLNAKARRTLAALVVLVVFLAVLVLLGALIAVPLVAEANELGQMAETYSRNLPQLLDTTLAAYHNWVPPAAAKSLEAGATAWATGLLHANYFGAAQWLVLRGWYLVELVLIPVLAFHLLRDGHNLRVGLPAYLPRRQRERGRLLLEDLHRILQAYVRGILILCLLFGAASTTLLWIAGTRVFVVLGMLAGLSWAVPIIGPIVAGFPVVGVTWAQCGFQMAMLVLVLYIGLNLLWSKIVFPHVLGDALQLHPLTVLIALLVVGQLLGPLGMLTAVPLAAIAKAVYVRSREGEAAGT